jgi:hypothetical protein
MSILNDAVLEEIKKIVEGEVKKDTNQVKLEDAKIIAQVLLPEIDRIVTAKISKFIRRLALDVVAWDLVKETEEEPVRTDDTSKFNFEEPTI